MLPEPLSYRTTPNSVAAKTRAHRPTAHLTWHEVVQLRCNGSWFTRVYKISMCSHRQSMGVPWPSSTKQAGCQDPSVAFNTSIRSLWGSIWTFSYFRELCLEQPSIEPTKNKELADEFWQLQTIVKQMRHRKANHVLLWPYLLHILLLDVAAWFTLWIFGTSFLPFLLCMHWLKQLGPRLAAAWLWASVILRHFYLELPAISFYDGPPQSGPCQLLGLYVPLVPQSQLLLPRPRYQYALLLFSDINMYSFFFAFGKILSGELETQKKKYMSYNHQHKYFFPASPQPCCLSTSSGILSTLLSSIKSEWICLDDYFLHQQLPHLSAVEGTERLPGFFFIASSLEHNWFVWVTQMNHIPTHTDHD